MSNKRIPQANRKGRGRIKYHYDHMSNNKVSIDKNTNCDNMCSIPILQVDNQDVIHIPRSRIQSNELEISTAANFSLPSQTDIGQDISGVNVDEWFKQRTESVSSIDLDAVIKNDGMDTPYLGDNIGHHFLSNKDVDMTCIVTNICDIGLGVDIQNSSSRTKHKPEIFTEKDCDNVILNTYSASQDPLLNHLNRNDLIDKDILDQNTEINTSHKPTLLESIKSDKQGLYVIGTSEEQFSTTDEPSHRKQSKGENLWNGSEVTDAHSADIGKDKSNWESLSTTSKRSTDADSEKEIDFPEFNLITFQIENNDAMSSTTQLPQVEHNNRETSVPSTTDDSDKINLINTRNNPTENISSKDQSVPVSSAKSITSVNSVAAKIHTTPVHLNNTTASNPRSILKSPLKMPNSIKKPNILKCQKDVLKKSPSMAIIAISTDKSKNTTEIVINTPYGEQVFRGKTTDLMKATSGLWQKLDNSKLQKSDQPLTISMIDGSPEETTSLQGDIMNPEIELSCDGPEDAEEIGESGTAEEDQPVVEALAELGISVDKDNIFCVTSAIGQKLWVCPIKDCGKMYQRQSMLKVHILSHFNVRPYRCNFAGCHWSFYTYFKLKRHKETHLKRKDFVCPIQGCDRRFTTIYNLNTHQKLHERPLEMVCPVEICAARFQTKRSLELHMKTHDKHHAPYKCSYEGCGKHYYSLNSLNSHSRSHQHKEEEVRCQWNGCGKLFDKPCRLKAHMRSHTGDKPYPCTYQDCGWAFSSASKLKRHQHKHTNERKFQCAVEGCGKSFMRSEHLKEHSLTHVGQRNFQCPFENCGVKFSAKSSLYVHMKKHNKTETEQSDKIVYHCPIERCVRTYTCKSSLRQHMLKFHTPVLANDPSQLDYIALLTGEDDLATFEGLQFSGDMATSGGISSLNAVSLVTPPSILMNSDGVGSVPPEYINTDFHLPGFMPAQTSSTGNSSSTNMNVNSGVVTHVVLAHPDNQAMKIVSGLQNTQLTLSNPMNTVETSSDIGVSTDHTLNMPLFEPISLDIDPSSNSVHGSARTSFTYQDIVRERDRKKGNVSPGPSTSIGMSTPTDVVLGTGLQDISHGFLLQDDLTNNHHNLYSEDHMMTVSPGVGEFQVLLLDSSSSSRHEFAESTINLRDLE